MFNTSFLLHRLIYRVLCQKDCEKPTSGRTSKDNSGTIPNIVIWFYVLKFGKENCVTVLCAGRSTKVAFNQLLHREFLMKKSTNIANIGIQSYMTKFSQKCFYFLLMALSYLQSALKHLIH